MVEMRHRDRETEMERNRERHRERHTQRQTDKRNRETHRDRNRDTQRDTQRETGRETEREREVLIKFKNRCLGEVKSFQTSHGDRNSGRGKGQGSYSRGFVLWRDLVGRTH